jgi:B-cell receptor-associated protein 31
MKQFRSQRNFYIAGFALFLWFVIKRLINLLSQCAREMADSAAARKQAEGAHRHLEGLMSEDPKKVDSKKQDTELEKHKQEATKAREEIDTLREQYDNSVREYDKLNEEHRKLQIKLAIVSGDESSKTK